VLFKSPGLYGSRLLTIQTTLVTSRNRSRSKTFANLSHKI